MKTYGFTSACSTCLLALLGAGCAEAAATPLRAGLAAVEITPPQGVTLVSYGLERQTEKVHDPLFARVLVLRTRDTSLALVASDLYRIHLPGLADRIRRTLQIEHTILSSSHNASAPALDEGGKDRVWSEATQEKIFQAVGQANENLFSAELSWGRGALIGGHNVRILQEDGSVRERWSDPEEGGTAPIDPNVTVIRVDQEAGGIRAVLVHYSCEPAILGPENREISADFPGAMARYIVRELGEKITCLFLQGAAANIYPFRSRGVGSPAFAEVQRMGERLGREAVRVAHTLKAAGGETELQAQSATLTFDNRWEKGKSLQVGLQTALINKTLGLVSVPGEMFIELQIGLSARSPAPVTLLLGSSYSSGESWAGYVPTITAAVEGGLGASYGTEIEPGAGEAMVNHSLVQLYRFLGQLDDLPRGRLMVEIPDLPSP